MAESEKSNWPLIIGGGAVLFVGAAAVTYFSSSGGPEQESRAPIASRGDAPPARLAPAADSADSAVKILEDREQTKREAERRKKSVEYNSLKIKCRDTLSKHYAGKINANERSSIESANYIMSVLGIESRMDYTSLDVNDPATNYYAYKVADVAMTNQFMINLHKLSEEAGENIPSREDLQKETEKWRAELYKQYGHCFEVPEGYGIVEVMDLREKGYAGFKGGPFVEMKSRPDVWIDNPTRKKFFDPNYDIGPGGLLTYSTPVTKGEIGYASIDSAAYKLLDFRNIPDLKKLSMIKEAFSRY